MIQRVPLAVLSLVTLAGCGGIESFLEQPQRSPEAWLKAHHFLELGSVVLSQPSSSVLVFLASVLAILFGVSLIREAGGHNSRVYWGRAFVLGGLGAICAGISYQAFGYEIKCRGREFCLWTSWWELGYLLLTVVACAFSLSAVGHSFLERRGQRRCAALGALSIFAYLVCLGLGLQLELRFLLSFEFMVLWTTPLGMALVGVVSKNSGGSEDRELLKAYISSALLLIAALVSHGIFGALGVGDFLWEKGIWFTENDLFHLGMILCLIYMRRRLFPQIRDFDPTS